MEHAIKETCEIFLELYCIFLLSEKNLKLSITRNDILKCGSIRVYVYVPTPPPPFLEGIAELVFRRVAYVPLSGIKLSRNSVCAVRLRWTS